MAKEVKVFFKLKLKRSKKERFCLWQCLVFNGSLQNCVQANSWWCQLAEPHFEESIWPRSSPQTPRNSDAKQVLNIHKVPKLHLHCTINQGIAWSHLPKRRKFSALCPSSFLFSPVVLLLKVVCTSKTPEIRLQAFIQSGSFLRKIRHNLTIDKYEHNLKHKKNPIEKCSSFQT